MSGRRAVEVAIIVVLLAGGAALRMRVADHWVFAGSDSYSYLRIGDEWLEHGRFALGPNEPLEWYRRPLYPLFVHAVRHGVQRLAANGDPGWPGWIRIERTQIALDVLGVGLLVLLLARRLGGPVAGIVALALAMLYPPMVLYACAALTEPLMALLTTATLACLILGSDRPRVWFPVAAALVALAAYLRPDGPLNGLAFVPALFAIDGWRRRGALAALSLAVFVALFAPWPIRNTVRFARPHLADGMVDRKGHDVPHYVGYWRWMQTWARDERPAGQPQSCFYDTRCLPSMMVLEDEGAFAATAGDGEVERGKVLELLALREREGVTRAVSDGFLALARRRRAAHPWRVLLGLPLQRAWHMWSAPQLEPLANPGWLPWPIMSTRLAPWLGTLSLLLLGGIVVAGGVLLAQRRTRIAAAILVTVIVARTVVLAWSAFCLPRYLIPIYPACFVLLGVAVGLGAAKLRRRMAAMRRQPNSGPRVTSAS